MDKAAAALRIALGVGLWSAHFALVYGGTALACAREWSAAVPWVIGVATLVAAMLALSLLAREWPRRDSFESWLTATVAAFAFVAIVFEGLPVLLLEPCR